MSEEKEVFPERWAIHRQGYSDVAKWFNENKQHKNERADFFEKLGGWYTHYPIKSGGHSDGSIKRGYTEITYAQFKQYVLKDPLYQLPLEPEGPEDLSYLVDIFARLNIEYAE